MRRFPELFDEAGHLGWRLTIAPGERALVYARFRDDADNVSSGPSVGTIVYRPLLWKRCDGNGDNNLDIGDAVWSLNHQFRGGPAGGCPAALYCNVDDMLNITDPIYLLNILFNGEQPFENFDVCEPFEGCPQNCP